VVDEEIEGLAVTVEPVIGFLTDGIALCMGPIAIRGQSAVPRPLKPLSSSNSPGR